MDNTQQPTDPRLPDVVTVTVSTPVDGTPACAPGRGPDRRQRARLDYHVQVDPQVLEAAQAACRPGERFVPCPDGTMRSVYVDQ